MGRSSYGFALLQVVLLLVGVGLVAGAGWYIWQSKDSVNKTLNTTVRGSGETTKVQPSINSFDECAKSGSPIEESYPEVCVTPGGKHFINPTQIAPAAP